MNTVAEKLILLRGDKSREEVANAIGVSKSAIAMYEQGERIPRDSIKLKLAEYYKCEVQDIFFQSISTRNVNLRGSEMRHLTLIGEMAKENVTIESMAGLLNLHRNTVSYKINEGTFNVEEAYKVRDKFFPGWKIEDLFRRE